MVEMRIFPVLGTVPYKQWMQTHFGMRARHDAMQDVMLHDAMAQAMGHNPAPLPNDIAKYLEPHDNPPFARQREGHDGVNLIGRTLPNYTKLEYADIPNADAMLFHALACEFLELDAQKARLDFANFAQSIFSGCDLREAWCNRTNFYHSTHYMSDFRDAKMFSPLMHECVFENPSFQGALLKDANASKSQFLGTNDDPIQFDGTKITGKNSNFQKARFEHCDFTGLQLTDRGSERPQRYCFKGATFKHCFIPYDLKVRLVMDGAIIDNLTCPQVRPAIADNSEEDITAKPSSRKSYEAWSPDDDNTPAKRAALRGEQVVSDDAPAEHRAADRWTQRHRRNEPVDMQERRKAIDSGAVASLSKAREARKAVKGEEQSR